MDERVRHRINRAANYLERAASMLDALRRDGVKDPHMRVSEILYARGRVERGDAAIFRNLFREYFGRTGRAEDSGPEYLLEMD